MDLSKGRVARYLTHPQVSIDPAVDVTRWSLNETGKIRVMHLAENLGALKHTTRIVSSLEVKALETAQPFADALGIGVELNPEMHENDRSSTGFLPPDVFEDVADQFFAQPECSVRGWERAIDAQARILNAVKACLPSGDGGDILFVGHGGVGTLLYCALSCLPIDRRYDQGPNGGGNWFQFSLDQMKPLQGWQPMETLSGL
ncbi:MULTISPECIES: histidine phosphatase family protein [unclassified Ruegeria]|uniref:histidine phosphatase family protein n=1 Tax=unclassified Ruegeria TaxID=2625375 RepID=UPI0014876E04|nr:MULTISPECIES: histidine phosphatase family protein [unclassified Ruegeria]